MERNIISSPTNRLVKSPYLMLDSQQIESDNGDVEDDVSEKAINRRAYHGGGTSSHCYLEKAVLEDVEEVDEEEEDGDEEDVFIERIYAAKSSVPLVPEVQGVIRRAWNVGWTVVHHNHLPKWLRDNDFLVQGHRPPLYSFRACMQSIFRIHTETGNIWTHLLGAVAFIGSAYYFLTRPALEVPWREKAIFSGFFTGAILCLMFSASFHTFMCHSKRVGRLFNKLDYCGIAMLTMGSFVPWLYYSFYCRIVPKVCYNLLILVLGVSCIVVSMWDKFAKPKFRPVRAGVFIGLGLSGVIPTIHYLITDGFHKAVYHASLGWLALMAFLYIAGAIIYALRVPERIWPGKFDIWFQSHQIFHICVVAAAFIHLHGITGVASYHLTVGDCIDEDAVVMYS